ncbi:MAG: tetratricopeptide repeat protein [Bacteroidales bacterium]|nr:tetratricopeptide repeat protein [Bacteroidales bacterium]
MSSRFLVFFLLLSWQGFGQYTQKEIFKNFTTNNITKWEAPIQNLANSPVLQNNDSLLLTYCNLLYGITGFYIAGKNKKAGTYLNQFFDAVSLLKLNPVLKSYYQTYSAAAIAYDMALRPYKIPFLANKSFSLAYAAIKTQPENPTAWVILGNAKYHAPALFGGNINEALKFFNTATTLWEHNRKTQDNWLYINTLAWQGFVNYKLGNFTEAKTIYTKVLKMAPNFFWVKNELLPDVEQKLEK